MEASNNSAAAWLQRVRSELRRDKKKTAILATLLIVGGVVGGRLVVSGGPAAAPAAVLPCTPAARPASAAKTAWAGDGAGSREARRETYVARMDRTIPRNIFKADLDLFPFPQGLPKVVASTGPAAPGFFDVLAERLAEQQAAAARRAEQINQIRAQAQALTLQTTVLGATKEASTAMINGQILRSGDVVAGFLVKDIAADSSVVSKDGVDVRLEMRH